jgi:hypothetical protein
MRSKLNVNIYKQMLSFGPSRRGLRTLAVLNIINVLIVWGVSYS